VNRRNNRVGLGRQEAVEFVVARPIVETSLVLEPEKVANPIYGAKHERLARLLGQQIKVRLQAAQPTEESRGRRERLG
jgi:hypothetical protein